MADFTLVDPKGWEYDLHSVYSAYIGYFQMYNIPWYERSWGHLFETFEEFLEFSWPVITVTDATSGRAHIVTRLNSIGAFIKMIKTRFGETLPQAPNILQIIPFETTTRHLRHVADYSSYRKLHSTLPAVVLSALKARVRSGEPSSIKELWEKKDKTFMAIDFEWNERNERTVLEWGYAAVRCGHLEALGHWPPVPDTNYRKGHYIVADYVDKVTNKYCPTYPWLYAFGESQVCPKTKLPQIIQAVISSLASPDSETAANQLVLVGHNIQGDLARLEEMKIKLPHNMLIIDTGVYERSLYSNGFRGVMQDPKSDKPRVSGSTLSLENLLFSLTLALTPSAPSGTRQSPQPPLVLPKCTLHNSGNDAMMCLFALQKLLEPRTTATPTVLKKTRSNAKFASMLNLAVPPGGVPPNTNGRPYLNSAGPGGGASGSMPMIHINGTSPNMNVHYAGYASVGSLTPPVPLSNSIARPTSSYDLADEFGQMQLSSHRVNANVNVNMTMNTNMNLGGVQRLSTQSQLTAPGRMAKRHSSFPGLVSGD